MNLAEKIKNHRKQNNLTQIRFYFHDCISASGNPVGRTFLFYPGNFDMGDDGTNIEISLF